MIELPATFLATMWSTANDLFTSFGGLIATIVGVLLGVVVIEMIIGAIRSHK
jgi:divalent metal cation (Fe/Co/Zn/Cd) transporter